MSIVEQYVCLNFIIVGYNMDVNHITFVRYRHEQRIAAYRHYFRVIFARILSHCIPVTYESHFTNSYLRYRKRLRNLAVTILNTTFCL